MLFHIPDMTCGGCVKSLEKAIALIDPKATLTADLTARTLAVDTSQPEPEILATMTRAGFSPAPQPGD